MQLHTDTILSGDLYAAAREAGVTIEQADLRGSRSKDHRWDIYLSGSSKRQSNQRDHKAATWDEWGVFMAALYRVDPDARWGAKSWGYNGSEDFHDQTQHRFENGMPADTHAQHKWVYNGGKARPFSGITYHYCNGCSAETKRSY